MAIDIIVKKCYNTSGKIYILYTPGSSVRLVIKINYREKCIYERITDCPV